MPHVTIEYSSNLGTTLDAPGLLRQVHDLLASYDTFQRKDIKSRCLRREEFLVSDGAPGSAFVHLRLDILSGRDASTKTEAGTRLLELLRKTFAGKEPGTRVDVSVEIRDMARESYFKLPQPV